MAEIKEISNEDLILIKSYVAYDESSPSCLIWINNTKYTNRIGKCAGSIVRDRNKDRYFEITINYRRFSCHRIVAALHGKDVNNFYIDHIDGNGLNNKIENLRTVTVGGNQRNRKRQDRNRSGITGVRLIKMQNGSKTKLNDYWEAGVYDANGKYLRKKFNCETLGFDNAKKMAIEWRNNNIQEVNRLLLEFGDHPYTDRHCS